MKLILKGHDERYTLEQSLANLFPGELPVYEPIEPGDADWAVVACQEEEDICRVRTELSYRAGGVALPAGGPAAARGGRLLLSGLSGPDRRRAALGNADGRPA